MCKTIRNMYDEKLTFENLVKACDRAHKNKSQKSSTIKYDMKLEENIVRTYDELKKCTYKIGAYHTFTIYEPKEREIKSLQFKDRVVQQWYIEEFIKPYIIPRFIDDTYACIKGKGTHGAVKKMQHYMQSHE